MLNYELRITYPNYSCYVRVASKYDHYVPKYLGSDFFWPILDLAHY